MNEINQQIEILKLIMAWVVMGSYEHLKNSQKHTSTVKLPELSKN